MNLSSLVFLTQNLQTLFFASIAPLPTGNAPMGGASHFVGAINREVVNNFCDTAEVSVGQHLYWQIGSLQVHGQVLITSWIVFAIIVVLSILANSNLKVEAP